MAESSAELNSGHGAIASRHMVTISEGLRVRRIDSDGNGETDERRRGTAFGRAVDISLDAAVDHFLGGFSVSYGKCNDSHDDPGQFVGQGGVGRPRDDGQPESSGPGSTRVA